MIAPLVLIGFLAASWALRPDSRRLPGASIGRVTPSPASEAPLLRARPQGHAAGPQHPPMPPEANHQLMDATSASSCS